MQLLHAGGLAPNFDADGRKKPLQLKVASNQIANACCDGLAHLSPASSNFRKSP